MRKKNFCLAVLSASAVLALGASFSSFAAWKSVNSEWVYTDNNGNNVTSAWRSDNGESYYLGSDGYMVRNTLLEDREIPDGWCADLYRFSWAQKEDDLSDRRFLPVCDAGT